MNSSEPKKIKFIGKTGEASSRTKRKELGSSFKRPNAIPEHILKNELLNRMIAELLPVTYRFEIHKTIHQVIENQVHTLALQIPEGLLQFSLIISDLIQKFCPCCQDVFILGDVTYGACCVDDFTAKALGCQMLVHYGHSCLIPVDQTSIKTLYVFVEIGIDHTHLRDTVVKNFPASLQNIQYLNQEIKTITTQESKQNKTGQASNSNPNHICIEHEQESNHATDNQQKEVVNLAVVGTVQFLSAVQALKHDLEELSQTSIHTTADLVKDLPIQISTPSAKCRFHVTVPQVKPLSPGEILGCTAPKLAADIDAILYIGDGRFHLESIMIANPKIPAFRYDPYSKKITYEAYDHFQMRQIRNHAIHQASASLNPMTSSLRDRDRDTVQDPRLDRVGEENEDETPDTNGDRQTNSQSVDKSWAVVLGTLGRQGSLSVLKSISEGFKTKSTKLQIIPILISELSYEKLIQFQDHISVFVQTSCPRLSIDWGEGFLRFSPSSPTTNNNKTIKQDEYQHGKMVEIPFLNPYEAKVALGQAPGFQIDLNPRSSSSLKSDSHPLDHQGLLDTYPMDFYADNSLGDWTPRFGKGRPPRRHHPVIESN